MTFRLARLLLAATVLFVVWTFGSGESREARAANRTGGQLFQNYYLPPGGYGSLGAQMYICPRPTPPWVGHTYVTYPPFMPHEFLYKHHRVYRRCNPDGGWTKTKAWWW